MVLPKVVGFKFTGELKTTLTATDLVLIVVKLLRERGVVGKFVEFYGEGVQSLTLADRATISNMGPEYGATIGFFPVDEQTLTYLRLTGRDDQTVARIEEYCKATGFFREYNAADDLIEYSDTLELDLSTVVPSLAGPKRPHDWVALDNMKNDFKECLSNPIGFKGFGLEDSVLADTHKFSYKGEDYELKQGSVVIAAITSCTNTSNPGVMLAAGLVAKKAIERGLKVDPYIKTSLSPGSGVVTKYLEMSGLNESLDTLGFTTAGYGCMTCIGNSGDLPKEVDEAIQDLVVCSVLSGNRNFEGRVHPLTRANYLASPPLVVAYALAGRTDICFETEPIGQDQNGVDVFLKDIFPTREEIQIVQTPVINSEMFREVYGKIAQGTKRWNELDAPEGDLFSWDEKSTYIHNPPFFSTMETSVPEIKDVVKAKLLLDFGDSVTTDHISPAGKIAKDSPAARYLEERGVCPKDFNTYGARRGNDEVMARGTFANVRLMNKLAVGQGPKTTYEGELYSVFDAAQKYLAEGRPTIIFAGKEYGSGSSRDWAAKGPYLQGIKVVIAQSYERIHRSNLVGMGIIPL